MSPQEASAWIAASVAVLAAIFELAVNNKKQAIDAVTANRLEWMSNVRSILDEFIREYIKRDSADKEKLLELACRFQLYTRTTNGDYDGLVSSLKKCADKKSAFSGEELETLLQSSQEVLNSAWVRVKIESETVFFRSERRIVRKTKRRLDEQKKRKH